MSGSAASAWPTADKFGFNKNMSKKPANVKLTLVVPILEYKNRFRWAARQLTMRRSVNPYPQIPRHKSRIVFFKLIIKPVEETFNVFIRCIEQLHLLQIHV